MNTAVVARNGNGNGHPPAAVVENVVIRGDLSKLSESERTSYYMAVCKSVGLNPLTKPFKYITLNGKLALYALRGCTDQLRAIYKVSVVDLIESERDGVFVVTAKMQNGEGRIDMAKGAVTIANLKGDALANAIMKAETKAKRRATLSLCGLGFLDETEIETVPGQRKNPHVTAPEDLVEDTTDNMPEGDGRITPLPKKNTRDQFEAMQKEMHATTTVEQLTAWGTANKNKKQMFQPDWQQILSGLYNAHMETLRNSPETGEIKPDALAEIDHVLSMVTDPGMLEKTFEFQCEPRIEPGMYDDAMAIYRKHEARLS